MIHSSYDNGKLGLANCSIDWANDANFAAVLLGDSYTPDLSTHSTYGDLTDEITDTDYSPVAVANRAVTLEGDGSISYTSDPVSFGTDVSISARYMVFVNGDPSNLQAGDAILSLHDFEEVKSSTNSEFSIQQDGSWFSLSEV